MDLGASPVERSTCQLSSGGAALHRVFIVLWHELNSESLVSWRVLLLLARGAPIDVSSFADVAFPSTWSGKAGTHHYQEAAPAADALTDLGASPAYGAHVSSPPGERRFTGTSLPSGTNSTANPLPAGEFFSY